MQTATGTFEHYHFPKELVSHQTKILATHRFFLNPLDTIFVIEKGKLDLFALSYEEGEADHLKQAFQQIAERFLSYPAKFLPGPLQFLASFEAGNWLFPFPIDIPKASICIIAIAREECELTLLNLPALRQALPRSTTLQIMAMDQIQNWINRLNEKNTGFVRPNLPLLLPPYDAHVLEAGLTFMKERGDEKEIAWLRIRHGDVYAWDLPQLNIDTSHGFYPMSFEEWFKCHSDSIVELYPSNPEFLLAEELWTGFFLFQRHFIILKMIELERNRLVQKKEIHRRVQRDEVLLGQSITDLESLLNPQTAIPPVPKEDLLFHACQIVGDQLDLKFTWPNKILGNNEEQLQDLCMNSQIYYRRVRLLDHWWNHQAFPFVAFYGEAKDPVALLPVRGGGYEVVNPSQEKKFAVNEEVSNQLSPFGYMFYRQLKEPRLTLRSIWNFIISKRRWEWLTFLFLVFCGTLASLALPIFTRFLFDEVIPNRNEFLLMEIALGAALISIVTLAFNLGREIIILRLESLSDHDMEMAIWQRLIQLPIRFFRRYSLYDLFTFTNAISSIRKLLVSHTIQVIFNAFFSIIYFFLMIYYSWILSLVGLAILAVEIIAIIIPVYFGVQYGRILLERQIDANNKMLEMVQALTKVRLAGAEARMFNRWEQSFANMIKIDLKALYLQLKSGVFNTLWSNTGTWILYFAVILIIFSQQATIGTFGTLTLGSYMAFISVFGLFSSAILQLGGALLNVVGAVPLWEKTKLFSEAEPEEISQKPDPGILQGEIRIDHLTFGYQPDIPPVIKDLSLVIHPGESVAFVGPSGCGKTTLLRLILGFEKSNQGSISYDNKDLKGLNLQAVRRQLGVVLQSGAIFDGTILENINSGRHYSPEQVQEALYLIGAETFIQELPMGIQTVLTNGGSALSGGQKQLILLARAIVGRPKILILDEATSSLDNHKQKIIYEHLERLSMTQIIVAQRLDTIQHVDRIYVIDEGRIIDEGTFAELANKPGLFADLLHKAIS